MRPHAVETERTNWATIVALAALTLIAAALRAYRSSSGLWFDEIVTLVESVRPPLRQILTEFPGNNNHPLYSWMAHVSISIFGESAWALRLPALVFGVLSIPMLYVLAATVTTQREALLGASVATVSYHHVWFSQNARGYTALLFWTLLATWLFIRLTRDPRTHLIAAYAITGTLGIYTHLTMAFVVAAHAMTWGAVWWSRTDPLERARDFRTALWSLGLAGAGAAIVYAPLFWQVYSFFSGPQQATAAFATPTWAVLEAVKGLRIGLGGIGALLAALLAVLGLLSYWRQKRFIAFLFTLPAVVTVAAMVATHAPLRPRFLFSLLGFAILLLVRGAFEVEEYLARVHAVSGVRRLVGPSIVGLIVVFSALSLPYEYRYPKQDFEGALRYVAAHRLEGEPVATAGAATYPLTRYYGTSWPAVQFARDIDSMQLRGRRLWLVYAFPEYMDAGLVALLRDRCVSQQVLIGTLGGGDVVVCAIPP